MYRVYTHNKIYIIHFIITILHQFLLPSLHQLTIQITEFQQIFNEMPPPPPLPPFSRTTPTDRHCGRCCWNRSRVAYSSPPDCGPGSSAVPSHRCLSPATAIAKRNEKKLIFRPQIVKILLLLHSDQPPRFHR